MTAPNHKFRSQVFQLALAIAGAFLYSIPTIATSAITPKTETSTPSQATTVSPTLIAQNRTQRIRFGRGTSGATLNGGIARGETVTYLLNAKSGQTMEVTVTSPEDNAVFRIVSPRRRTLIDETSQWSDELPATGDYRIIVGSTRGGASYRLTVTVE